jgi:cobalt/nickel transport system ATP-binding protein
MGCGKDCIAATYKEVYNLLFKLQNIGYCYQVDRPAIQDLSVEIAAGERLVLLGPNGCGKSTLQKILAGLIFASQGEFWAYGTRITKQKMQDKNFATAYRRKVGFVFQNSDVQLFCPSVLDEVMFGPLAMGVPYAKAKAQAEEILECIGITSLANRLPHHLSGGEKKKVAIAAILVVNPEVLILDEPTNGLDPKTQRWMRGMLQQLNECGKTIIIATHQLDSVPDLADRVVVMGDEHTIMADDKPAAILTNQSLLLAANIIDQDQHVHFHQKDEHMHVHHHI